MAAGASAAAKAAPGTNTAARPLAGIAFVVVAVACFATLDTTTKYVTAMAPLLMALWFRYAIQAVGTTLVVLPRRGLAVFRTEHPRFQLLRGVLLLSSSSLAFFSLAVMPVADFTAIVMVVPLVITVLAATTLGDRVSPLRWALVAGGFAGTLLILRPGGHALGWSSLLPLGLVVVNAWFQVLTSRMARLDDPITTHLYTGWIGTLLASLALPFVWHELSGWQPWAAFVLMGTMGAIGHYLLILGYQRAPAATLTPYLYGQIAFAMLGGFLVFRQTPDALSLVGIVLIALCGTTGAWLTVREGRIVVQPVED